MLQWDFQHTLKLDCSFETVEAVKRHAIETSHYTLFIAFMLCLLIEAVSKSTTER